MSSAQRTPASTVAALDDPDVQVVPSGSDGLQIDTLNTIDQRLELLLGRVNKLENSLSQLNVTYDRLMANEIHGINGNVGIDEKISETIQKDFQKQMEDNMMEPMFVDELNVAENEGIAAGGHLNLDDDMNELSESHIYEPITKPIDD